MNDTIQNNEASTGSERPSSAQKTKFTIASGQQMILNGWRKAGWTNDPTMLAEIHRDYTAKGYLITFTEGSKGKTNYWIKQNTNQENHDRHVVELSSQQNRTSEKHIREHFEEKRWNDECHIHELLKNTHKLMSWAQTETSTIMHFLEVVFSSYNLSPYAKACMAGLCARWASERAYKEGWSRAQTQYECPETEG